MKKSTLFLFLMAFLCLNLNAQKVKIKDLDVRAKYCVLPSIGMPIGATSYHVELSLDENTISRLGYTTTGIKNSFKIDGYHKSDEAVGVKVLFETVDSPSGTPLKLNTTKKKNKEGKTWNEYSYSIVISGKSRVRVIDETGKIIGEDIQSYSETKTTSTYTSTAQLKKQTNTEKLYLGGRTAAFSSLLGDAKNYVQYKFALIPQDKKVDFKRLHSKKHPDYKKFLAIEDVVTKSFEKMTIHSNEEYKTMIQPAIDFWIENEPNYSGSEKHPKKLKYACQYNLALAYFYAEDLENSSKWATLVQNGDYKEKHGKKLLKKIEDLKAKFKTTGMDSRHILIEMSEEDVAKAELKIAERKAAIESGDIQAFPDFNTKLNVKNNSEIVKGAIHHSGGSVNEGYLVYENKYLGRPDFRKPNSLRFGYLKDGKIAVGSLKYSGIKHMVINDIRYDIQDVVLGTGLAQLKLENAVIDRVADYERTSLILVIPPFMRAKGLFGSNDTDLEAELSVYNKEEDKLYVTKSLFGSNKAIKKIIKGCATAEAHLEKTKEERKKESLFTRLAGFDNAGLLEELLEKYDGCE